jgi:hypothetical protein
VTSPQEKAEWRAEFERIGEMHVYDNAKQGTIYNNEKKRLFAFVWLGNKNGCEGTATPKSFDRPDGHFSPQLRPSLSASSELSWALSYNSLTHD